jgi:predicted O-methyltransferase YrrM
MRVNLDFWRSVDPGRLFQAVAEEENRNHVTSVMKRLTTDPVWTERIVTMVESGQIETRCFVAWLARELQPRTYLEVGVRRGFSMAMVASIASQAEVYGFDLWIPGYFGPDTPSSSFVQSEFVQSEMASLKCHKKVHLITGDSHRTLPAFFGSSRASLWDKARLAWRFRQRPTTFDLITIDGDHSLLGAYQDLVDTMTHCSVGGAVVFDDIAPDCSTLDPEAVARERGEDPHSWHDLLGVWHAVQQKFGDFRYFEYTRNPPGVGLAIRLR